MNLDFTPLFSAFEWFLPLMFIMSKFAFASMSGDIKPGLERNQTLIICSLFLLITLGLRGALASFNKSGKKHGLEPV